MRRWVNAAVAAVVAAAVLAVSAIAVAGPPNGGFEQGTFKGWKRVGDPNGRWLVYKKGDGPQVGKLGNFPKPPEGKRAAIADQVGSGTRILHRTLKLKPNRKIKLSFYVFYRNHAERFYTPKTLDVSPGVPMRAGGAVHNQQYRIDLMKPGAPLRSVKKAHILKTLFRTKVGDPNVLKPKKLKFNLTRFAGRTVRLRFAEVDTELVLNAGVDAVKLTQRKP
ncbi:MAG TPA: hypothetical protein VIL04_03305 [Solirubrobacterales bacterium]|jgi:hypothetical protein